MSNAPASDVESAETGLGCRIVRLSSVSAVRGLNLVAADTYSATIVGVNRRHCRLRRRRRCLRRRPGWHPPLPSPWHRHGDRPPPATGTRSRASPPPRSPPVARRHRQAVRGRPVSQDDRRQDQPHADPGEDAAHDGIAVVSPLHASFLYMPTALSTIQCVVRPVPIKRSILGRATGRQRECRVEVWRGGLGRSLFFLLARPFVCGCPTISTMPRFHTPLIEPCGRISRTRLSDRTLHSFGLRADYVAKLVELHQSQVLVQVTARVSCVARPLLLVLLA